MTPSSKGSPISLELINADLMPTAKNDRFWIWRDIGALWFGMVVCAPAYLLVGELISFGLSAVAAMLTIFVANLIAVALMIAIGHAGTKYGIVLPVLLRASFGTRGAKLPALLRSLFACVAFAVQTWLCAVAIYTIANALSFDALRGEVLPSLGIDVGQAACLVAIWLLQLWLIHLGVDAIRRFALRAAPWLLLICVVLLYFAQQRADGFANLMSVSAMPGGAHGTTLLERLLPAFAAALTFALPFALIVPDLTRYARSQREQVLGQVLGLPVALAGVAFLAVALASAAQVSIGAAIRDPLELTLGFGGLGMIIALVVFVLAALTTNVAAFAVAAANGFSALSPRHISFRRGGYLTAAIALALVLWRLLGGSDVMAVATLHVAAAVLVPLIGIVLVDYWWVRRSELSSDDLYKRDGHYRYRYGINPAAFFAWGIGMSPSLPIWLQRAGLVAEHSPLFDTIAAHAAWVGPALAVGAYALLMRRPR